MALILILYALLDEHTAESFKRFLTTLLFLSANGSMSDREDTSIKSGLFWERIHLLSRESSSLLGNVFVLLSFLLDVFFVFGLMFQSTLLGSCQAGRVIY